MRTAQIAVLIAALACASAHAAPTCPDLLNRSANRLQDDKPLNLCAYAGQVVLIVNTASQCGYTGQYEGLESLYRRYRNEGFVVLGFPSNDFGGQEPGSNRQIADFCKNTFDIQFPMFAKTSVTGSQANPLFKQLTQSSGSAPRWNFHKYLIGRDGRVLGAYPSQTDPSSTQLNQAIQAALTVKP